MQVSDTFALRWLEAQAHRRPWVSLGWVRRYCRYSERASCFISATYSLCGHDLAVQLFDRNRLDESPGLPDLEVLLGGVHPARDPLAC